MYYKYLLVVGHDRRVAPWVCVYIIRYNNNKVRAAGTVTREDLEELCVRGKVVRDVR